MAELTVLTEMANWTASCFLLAILQQSSDLDLALAVPVNVCSVDRVCIINPMNLSSPPTVVITILGPRTRMQVQGGFKAILLHPLQSCQQVKQGAFRVGDVSVGWRKGLSFLNHPVPLGKGNPHMGDS